jgi:hypothetical protein
MHRLRRVCDTYGIQVYNSKSPLVDCRSSLQLFATLECVVDKVGFLDFSNVGEIRFELVANP